MKREQKSLTNKGFSLVELIIVVAIMAVLIGVLAPQYLRYVEKTRLQRDAMVVFGYPTKQQMERRKPKRCQQKYIVHENGYRPMDEGELRGMLRKEYNEDGDFESWIQAFCRRKYDSDFSREMSRSVEEYLKAFQ